MPCFVMMWPGSTERKPFRSEIFSTSHKTMISRR
jgi:hypothetical protein